MQVLQSAPMGTGYKIADDTRLAILRALADAGPDGCSIRALARQLGMAYSGIHRHVGELAGAGLIAVNRRMGQRGAVVKLTEAGRLALRMAVE